MGRVTVRFEVPGPVRGRVHTFAVEDPALSGADPLPLTGRAPDATPPPLP